jgi:hypothetical protein
MQHTYNCLLLTTTEPESRENIPRYITVLCVARVAKQTQVNINRSTWRSNGKSLIDVCPNYVVCCHALSFATDVAFAEA